MGAAGAVRVAAEHSWAELWLKPRLGNAGSRLANIEVEVNPDGSRAADFTIDFPDSMTESDVEPLYTDYVLPLCSPHVASLMPSVGAHRLEGLPLLHIQPGERADGRLGWPEWVAAFGHRQNGAGRGARYRLEEQALWAAVSGAGFVMARWSLAADYVERGDLVPPFDVTQGFWHPADYVLKSRSGALRRPANLRFREWLAGEAAQAQALLTTLIARQAPAPEDDDGEAERTYGAGQWSKGGTADE